MFVVRSRPSASLLASVVNGRAGSNVGHEVLVFEFHLGC